MGRAAAAGMENAAAFFDQTPKAFVWQMEALAARRRAADESAWMAAKYLALAVYAPEKMPRKPAFYPAAVTDMSDETIQSRLIAWAKEGQTT